MRQAMRLLVIVCLVAVSSGMIAYSVRNVRYQVGSDKLSEFTVNEFSLYEGIERDAAGKLDYVMAPVSDQSNLGPRVACADTMVAISAMQGTVIAAQPVKKPVKKAPATKPSVGKPAPKAPVKTPAKAPATKKPAPKKPAAGKACPT